VKMEISVPGQELSVRERAKKLPLTPQRGMLIGYVRAAAFYAPFSRVKILEDLGKEPVAL